MLKATIDLGHCLNLLDTAHFDRIEQAYFKVIRNLNERGVLLPSNARKRHELDYVVIEAYCDEIAMTSGEAFHTVRGCFPEGRPLYPRSRIMRETHIQVGVRDPECITALTVVD